MTYATLYTDKYSSAKMRVFNSYEELRKYLVSEVVAADTGSMNLGELVSVYNVQNSGLIEVSYAAYISTKGEVVYY